MTRLFVVLIGVLATAAGCGQEEASSPPPTAPSTTSTSTSTSTPPTTANPASQRASVSGTGRWFGTGDDYSDLANLLGPVKGTVWTWTLRSPEGVLNPS